MASGSSTASLIALWDLSRLEDAQLDLITTIDIDREPISQAGFEPAKAAVPGGWDAAGALYIAAANEGAWRWVDGQLDELVLPFQGVTIANVAPVSGDRLFVGTIGGSNTLDLTSLEVSGGTWPAAPSFIDAADVAYAWAGLSVQDGDSVLVLVGDDPLDGRVDAWSTTGGHVLSSPLPVFPTALSPADIVRYDPGAEVAAVDCDCPRGISRIYDLSTDTAREVELDVGTDPVFVDVSWTPDGLVAAAVSADGSLSVHRLPGGGRIDVAQIVVPDVRGVAITPDLTHALISDEGPGLTVVALSTGEIVDVLDPGGDGVTDVMLRPDLRLGYVNSESETLVFDLETLKPVDSELVAEVKAGPITDADSNGYFLLSTEDEGVIYLVNAFNETVFGVLISEESSGGRYSPSDDYVFGIGDSVQVWDRRSRQPITPVVPGNTGSFPWSRAITQVIDGRAHVWNNEPETWAQRACEIVGRNLTPEEWARYMPTGLEYRPTCPQYAR